MNKLPFFTPVNFEGDISDQFKVFQAAENYFNFGSHYAIPVDGGMENLVRLTYRESSSVERLIISALKIASYVTLIFPLIMLIIKIVFRNNHSYVYLENPKYEQEIEISFSVLAKIKGCMKKILAGEECEGVRTYNCQPDHRVFSLSEAPDLIFKMDVNPSTTEIDTRKEAIKKAKEICKTHELGLLIIPQIKVFNIGEYPLLAERKLEVAQDVHQEETYVSAKERLNPALLQLTRFICLTGYNDVEWRNNPLFVDEDGLMKIALIDLEFMESASMGLFGKPKLRRRGLVNCVNKEQGEMVIEEAKKHLSFEPTKAEKSLKRRREELVEDEKLGQFHLDHHIVDGWEKLSYKLRERDFTEQAGGGNTARYSYPLGRGNEKQKELCLLSEQLKDVFNDVIVKNRGKGSKKDCRKIGVYPPVHLFDDVLIILKKLKELGHIFKYKPDRHFIEIQA